MIAAVIITAMLATRLMISTLRITPVRYGKA